jgi:xylan 1,4-beta-xylosidase
VSLRELPPQVHPCGEIVLDLRAATPAGVGRPSFLGRRQTHQEFDASLVVDVEPPLDGEEASMAIHQTASGFATVTLQQSGGERILALTVEAGSGQVPPIRVAVSPGDSSASYLARTRAPMEWHRQPGHDSRTLARQDVWSNTGVEKQTRGARRRPGNESVGRL